MATPWGIRKQPVRPNGLIDPIVGFYGQANSGLCLVDLNVVALVDGARVLRFVLRL